MDVFTDIFFDKEFVPRRNSSVTIGNFDGCHLGHQDLICRAIEYASSAPNPSDSIAVSFEPSAEQYFGQQPTGHNLFSPDQKRQALSELGLDILVLQSFDDNFSKVTHQDFFETFLLSKLGAKVVSIGYDFKFGHNRQGDFEFLKRSCAKNNIVLNQLQPTMLADEIISSSKIRAHLLNGTVEKAKNMLGRHYMILGRVERGSQLGRQIGFPTANLHEVNQIMPSNGVYCGWVYIEGKSGQTCAILKTPKETFPAIFNIGLRPTISSNAQHPKCEVHILDQDFGDNLYGKQLRVYFEAKIRDEVKFPKIEALKKAIEKDIVKARKLLEI